MTTFVLLFSVEVASFEAWRVELTEWVEMGGAIDHRLYSEDGSVSVFLDYATEEQADVSRVKLKKTWPFRHASLVADTAYVCHSATRDPPRGVAQTIRW